MKLSCTNKSLLPLERLRNCADDGYEKDFCFILPMRWMPLKISVICRHAGRFVVPYWASIAVFRSCNALESISKRFSVFFRMEVGPFVTMYTKGEACSTCVDSQWCEEGLCVRQYITIISRAHSFPRQNSTNSAANMVNSAAHRGRADEIPRLTAVTQLNFRGLIKSWISRSNTCYDLMNCSLFIH